MRKNTYKKPILTNLGQVEELTKGGTAGTEYDEFGSPGEKN